MLDGEQPNARDRRHDHRRKLDLRDTAVAENKSQAANQASQRYVRQVEGVSLAPPALARVKRRPIEEDEYDRRQQQVGDDRMIGEAHDPSAPPRQGAIFRDRHARRIDIQPAGGAPIQIVPRTVMSCMLPAPEGVRRQRHQAAQDADQVVRASRLEERAMPAIVLNDEDADEKAGGDYRHWQRHPQRNREAQVHRGTAGEKPAERGRKLRQAARQYRRLKCHASE